MLELPELDIYRTLLAEQFAGAQITGIEVINAKTFQASQEQWDRDIVLKSVWFVERRGKFLLFHLDNGKRLRIHLGQGAYLYKGSEDDHPGRSAQVKLHFGERILYFVGLRTDDMQLLTAREVEEQLGNLGPDPFQKSLTLNRFIERFSRKRGSIKTALMDQNVISGIGTVYSDEICFAAAVRPDAKISVFERESWARLYESMHKVLKEAVSCGGIGVHPFSADDQLTGGYASQLQVYNREGQICEESGTTIEKIDVSGRKAFVSPGFQQDQ
ncbi:endonuclease VIII [Paenibacillus alkaliterrae]|uniref:Fpg/Nei family DNA glycosylase n=1 Tax=Paenibacillus alkaliterrae TaxID=320909 RepID=UPI001F466125|nr:DNA-formamidopyrimidine glycosylase family protein [Paenibacillus alkaliterrae]MCF2938292.1 endonuclease VIII [Paenibacillus alkaliterrae]